MIAKIMDGIAISNSIKKKIFSKVKHRIKKGKRVPGLAIILIGDNPASKIYVKNKLKFCDEVNFFYKCYHLPFDTHEYELLELIKKLNVDKKIDGIIIQLPIPKNFNKVKILECIVPHKDVDGFHPYNIGRLCQRYPLLRPCTPYGIITLLKWYNIDTYGLNAVIIGASNIVGRPMCLELLLAGCTVTITHRFTKNLNKYINKADLLIVAVGKAGFISGNQIKSGSIIIDVGINPLKDGKVIGDIDFLSVLTRASYITPVPGGVGPITVAMLMKNTLKACEAYHYSFTPNAK